MTKWCITWDDAEYFLKIFKEKEKEWEESYTPKYLDSSGLEYALRVLFEHKGFWLEEKNDN